MYSLIIAPKDTLRETQEPTFDAVEHLADQAANGSLERRLTDLEISVRKLKVSVERLCSWTKRSDVAFPAGEVRSAWPMPVGLPSRPSSTE
ncbi:MAG: hypothetical protein K0Q60_2785 [Microvirga sp.]|nr:hypothetical protein [Microvirga sp.]